MCVLKMNPDLTVVDYFAPALEALDSSEDLDIGNVGPVLIPNTQLLFLGATKYKKGDLLYFPLMLLNIS